MDQQAISNLIYAYARHIDQGNFEAVAELFRNGGIYTDQGQALGYDQVLAMYTGATRRYPDDGTPKTQHITTNLAIEIHGNQAHCQSYFSVLQAVPPDFPLQTIISGRYEDEFLLGDQGWTFKRRHIQPTLFGDLSKHLLIDSTQLGG